VRGARLRLRALGKSHPVVAAIIEHEGQVLLARGKNWPEKMFALVTGFLEADESRRPACCAR